MTKKPKQKRVYSAYDKKLQATPKEVSKRVERNRARREAIKSGRAKVGDGKDVHHPKGAAAGKQKTRVMSRSKNRAMK